MKKNQIAIISILIFSLFSSQPIWAMDIWVLPSESMASDKLEALIRTLPEDLLQNDTHPYTDYQTLNPITLAQREEITQQMAKALEMSKRGRHLESAKIFDQIITGLKSQPNVGGIQKLMLDAMIKCAEEYAQAKELEQEKSMWKLAFSWGPSEQLSPDIFSKNTIEKFEEVKKENSSTRQTTVRVQAPRLSLLFLDGRKIKDTRAKIKVYPGFHQWAILIPGSSWQIKNFQIQNLLAENSTGESFASFTFKPLPLLKGSCDAPELRQNTPMGATARILAVYKGGDCLRAYDGKNWYDSKGNLISELKPSEDKAVNKSNQRKLSEFQSLPKGIDPKIPESNFAATDSEGQLWANQQKPSFFSKLSHSPWFWVGLGIVTAGTVMIVKQQQDQPAPVIPSQTHN